MFLKATKGFLLALDSLFWAKCTLWLHYPDKSNSISSPDIARIGLPKGHWDISSGINFGTLTSITTNKYSLFIQRYWLACSRPSFQGPFCITNYRFVFVHLLGHGRVECQLLKIGRGTNLDPRIDWKRTNRPDTPSHVTCHCQAQ